MHPTHEIPEASLATIKLKMWQIILFVIALPVVLYILLPIIGFSQAAQLFSGEKIAVLIAGLVAVVGYWKYLSWVEKHLNRLIYFMVAAWVPAEFLSSYIINQLGFNTHLRSVLILLLLIPLVIATLKHVLLLWRNVIHIRWYALFYIFLTAYFVFFNAHAADPKLLQRAPDAALDQIQFVAYTYSFFGMSAIAVYLFKARDPLRAFDHFNTALIIGILFQSLVAIAAFPFNLLTMNVDGFVRSAGMFAHPNPFAHQTAIVCLYLLGLLCYYRETPVYRISKGLLLTTLALALISFMLALSKSALLIFCPCAALILLLNLSSVKIRRLMVTIVIAAIILLPLAVVAYQTLADKNLWDILADRFSQTGSVSWRTTIWQGILANMDGLSLILGHGFTASNMLVYQMTYTSMNQEPLMLVHNGYIQAVYDLGLAGLTLFIAALSGMWSSLQYFLISNRLPARILWSTAMALCLYFLLSCATDEMLTMFNASELFWFLISIITAYCLRQRAAGTV